jgi:hypothetical protein
MTREGGGMAVTSCTCKKRQRRLVLVADGGVDNADGKQGSCLDVLVLGNHVLVNLRQTALHVPQQEHAKGSGGAHAAAAAVLEHPALVLSRVLNELVLAGALKRDGW